jgi:hypothetical protein
VDVITALGDSVSALKPPMKTPTPIVMLVGAALASASALLAIWLMSYGYATGGLAHNDPLLVAGFQSGIAISAAASVFVGISLRRPSRLRWLGLVFALAGLLFWITAAVTGRI